MVGIQPPGAAVTYAFLNFYTAESALAAAAACRGKVLPWLTGEQGSWHAKACAPGNAMARQGMRLLGCFGWTLCLHMGCRRDLPWNVPAATHAGQKTLRVEYRPPAVQLHSLPSTPPTAAGQLPEDRQGSGGSAGLGAGPLDLQRRHSAPPAVRDEPSLLLALSAGPPPPEEGSDAPTRHLSLANLASLADGPA